MNLDELATRALMSRRQFTRRFRAEAGVSPWQWLLAQRLAEAQRLLEGTAEPVTVGRPPLWFRHAAGVPHQLQAARRDVPIPIPEGWPVDSARLRPCRGPATLGACSSAPGVGVTSAGREIAGLWDAAGAAPDEAGPHRGGGPVEPNWTTPAHAASATAEPAPNTHRGVDEWFLTAQERGNPHTELDSRHADGAAWSTGNLVRPLVHGAAYFSELLAAIRRMRADDQLMLTDWRGDPDELLGGRRHRGRARPGRCGPSRGRRPRPWCGVRIWTSCAPPGGESPAGPGDPRGRRGVFCWTNGSAAAARTIRSWSSCAIRAGRRLTWRSSAASTCVTAAKTTHPHAGEPAALPDRGGVRAADRRGTTSRSLSRDRPSPTWRQRSGSGGRIRRRSPATRTGAGATGRCGRTGRGPARPGCPRPTQECGPHAVQILRTYPYRRPGYAFAPERRAEHRPRLSQGPSGGRTA